MSLCFSQYILGIDDDTFLYVVFQHAFHLYNPVSFVHLLEEFLKVDCNMGGKKLKKLWVPKII